MLGNVGGQEHHDATVSLGDVELRALGNCLGQAFVRVSGSFVAGHVLLDEVRSVPKETVVLVLLGSDLRDHDLVGLVRVEPDLHDPAVGADLPGLQHIIKAHSALYAALCAALGQASRKGTRLLKLCAISIYTDALHNCMPGLALEVGLVPRHCQLRVEFISVVDGLVAEGARLVVVELAHEALSPIAVDP